MTLRSARDAAVPLLAIVLVVLVVIAIVAIVVFAPIRSVDVDERIAISVQEGAEELVVQVQADLGKVTLQFMDPPENQDQLVLTVQGSVRQNLLASGDPVSISFGHEIYQSVLTVSIGVDVSSFSTTVGYDDLVIGVSVAKGLRTSFQVEHAVGDVVLTAGQGVMLGDVALSTTTGMVKADLGPGTLLTDDIEMRSTTGASVLEWNDVNTSGQRRVSMSTTTGGIEMDVIQTSASGNVTFESTATTGGVELHLQIEDDVSAQVSSSANIGNVDVERRDGFTGDSDLLTSTNHPAAMSLLFALSTNTGGVELDLSFLSG